MKNIEFGQSVISEKGPCYVIAEIGGNHRGDLETAFEMIKVAAECGVQAVKFQKRNNEVLYTKTRYNQLYNSENSYGSTYGAHRNFLEFDWDEHKKLKKYAKSNNVEYLCTAFDFPSVYFLEKLDIPAYKIASGDLTNLPFLTHIAKLGKPMIVSTGCATMEEIRFAYDTILKYNKKLCLLHCVASYPAEYKDLDLRFITTLKKEFPEAIIGYSGHDNGILAPSIAYMLGAIIIEKHFTLNRSWKGTDQKFSLEPIGLKKMVRDLGRIDIALGDGIKQLQESEIKARVLMGKSIFANKPLSAGKILTEDDICLKSPGDGLPPYKLPKIIGKRVKRDLKEEDYIFLKDVE